MEDILVSVIVPIYNVEKYLEECIKSIVEQSYKNLEIILVDDGSLDACPKICDEWAKRDRRIIVLHKKNEGLGISRNVGLNYAHGKYIYFIDSDDYIEKNMIEECVKTAIYNNTDIVLFGFNRIRENNVLEKLIPNLNQYCFKDNIEIKEKLIPELIASNPRSNGLNGIELSACTILISAYLIRKNNWKFVSERQVISEDVCSLISLYCLANKVIVMRKTFYYYRMNPMSITHYYDENRIEKIEKFYKYCLEEIIKYELGEETKKRLQMRILGYIIVYMRKIVNTNMSFFEKVQKFDNICKSKFVKDIAKENIRVKKISKKIVCILLILKMKICLFYATNIDERGINKWKLKLKKMKQR